MLSSSSLSHDPALLAAAASALADVRIVGDIFAPVSASHDTTCSVTCLAADTAAAVGNDGVGDDDDKEDSSDRARNRCSGSCPGYQKQGSVSDVRRATSDVRCFHFDV